MNLKVCIVVTLGILVMLTLCLFPPWKVYGTYAGHFRVDRVAWLDFDSTRFFIEQSLVLLATLLIAFKTWSPRRKAAGKSAYHSGEKPDGAS